MKCKEGKRYYFGLLTKCGTEGNGNSSRREPYKESNARLVGPCNSNSHLSKNWHRMNKISNWEGSMEMQREHYSRLLINHKVGTRYLAKKTATGLALKSRVHSIVGLP